MTDTINRHANDLTQAIFLEAWYQAHIDADLEPSGPRGEWMWHVAASCCEANFLLGEIEERINDALDDPHTPQAETYDELGEGWDADIGGARVRVESMARADPLDRRLMRLVFWMRADEFVRQIDWTPDD